jgi:hypothetical protein
VRLKGLYAMLGSSCFQYSFKLPVTWSISDFGAGPMPSTVALPAATCVLPASYTTFAVRDNDIAAA